MSAVDRFLQLGGRPEGLPGAADRSLRALPLVRAQGISERLRQEAQFRDSGPTTVRRTFDIRFAVRYMRTVRWGGTVRTVRTVRTIATAVGNSDVVQKDGQSYQTIAEAAKALGVSQKTVREWIAKGIIPEPPTIEHGVRTLRHFPPAYMIKAKAALQKYRERKASQAAKLVRRGSA